jgi:antitoxin MazE
MRVSKWGNSLAIRLPSGVVEALHLREGDEIEVTVRGQRTFEINRDTSREEALSRLRALRKPLPAGWRFDREEANSR